MRVVAGDREFAQRIADYVLMQFPNMMGVVPSGSIRPYQAVAFVDGQTLHGGLIMSDYRVFDAQVTIYADTPRFIGLHALQGLMHWAFDDIGLQRVTCLVDPKNKKSRKFAEKIGFKLEGKMRKGLDGMTDALIYGMLREDARFLKPTGG